MNIDASRGFFENGGKFRFAGSGFIEGRERGIRGCGM